ncbi:MAG: hypothetical protein KJI69_01185 [Patescibacteria group bacterium]|nr:hypothetical protein [Patescibacteria group bacterium]
MSTKFTKFKQNSRPKWIMLFHAGTEWLQAFQILRDESKKISGTFLFFVYPHVLYFSMELFVKSLAAHKNPDFDAKKDRHGHSATDIIKTYKKEIPIFSKIIKDKKLFDLIKEYEKTIDTRFGDTGVQLKGPDTKLMIKTVYKLREEMTKLTGLK